MRNEDTPQPKEVKCPMCGNRMSKMGIKDTTDLTMNTLNYSESDSGKQGKKKHFVSTTSSVIASANLSFSV